MASQRPRNHPGAVLDERQVRLAMRSQRRRHADDDGIRLGEASEVGGGFEPAFGAGTNDAVVADVLEWAVPVVDGGDPPRIDIEAEHAESALSGSQRQRQADIAETDHAEARRPAGEARDQGVHLARLHVDPRVVSRCGRRKFFANSRKRERLRSACVGLSPMSRRDHTVRRDFGHLPCRAAAGNGETRIAKFADRVQVGLPLAHFWRNSLE